MDVGLCLCLCLCAVCGEAGLSEAMLIPSEATSTRTRGHADTQAAHEA